MKKLNSKFIDKLKKYFLKKFRNNIDFLRGLNDDMQFINLNEKKHRSLIYCKI